jgi:hypothetical protein
MRNRFLELIDNEISLPCGRQGRIVAKMNALEDPVIVRKLYEASQAGVTIDLIVRGNCRLRPGIPASARTSASSASSGASSNTRASSISTTTAHRSSTSAAPTGCAAT